MNTLVTGGAGFIGSNLVDELLERGHRVTILDDFSTGRRQNLAHLKGREDVRVVRADISSEAPLAPYCEGIDWVFHLAGLADIVPSIRDPLAYHRANVDGTFRILEACRAAGVRRFVYAASSSCYGIAEVYPTPEEAPANPRYPYALTKHVGEQYVMHWGKVYGLPVISLRLFNVYGPRSRTSGAYGAVFGVFLAQKLKGLPFTVVGDGRQTRDFTFVTDVARAFIAAASSTVRDEILNVGSGQPRSVNELVALMEGDVIYIPKRPGEPDCTRADISKIRARLGWAPRVGFEDGVKALLSRINDWRDAPVWTPESISEATREWFDCLGT